MDNKDSIINNLSVDTLLDRVTIFGITYTGDFFRMFRDGTATDEYVKIETVEGVVTLTKIRMTMGERFEKQKPGS